MKYKYIGEGPFPLEVYGIGVIRAYGDTLETDEPINHKHFVVVTEKRDKTVITEGEK